ncbi:glycosyl transferase [Parageobacillus genomosp. 1]|uniref:Glycosyl transferase n=1 Tax=Parageobacillus genomosp. 1 TaxID=1295642 RepID=A0ABC9VAS9_9BACL|nr:glycosyltransferase [Parageobacillus genomosp. 1]EZP75250.1 glycosyl transferase [Parageobacillus genomosp. 1]
MKKNIILLTNNFPYGSGEEFLETELQYLSQSFEKIVILSMNNKSPKTRDLPNNVAYERFRRSVIPFYLITLLKMLIIELCFLYKNKKFKYANVKRLIVYTIFASINVKQIEKCIKKYKLKLEDTVIYGYWANQNVLAALLLKNKMPELTFITRAHRYDLYEEAHEGNYLPFRSYIYKNIDFIFTISDQGKNYLLSRYGNLLNSKVETSRLGVNKKFTKEKDFSISKKGNELFIVSCSYLSPVKRIDLLIKELAQIDDINIKWRHIGGGYLWDELNELAEIYLKPKKNIDYKFLGHQKNSEIYKYYLENDIDLFINVSESEGIPVTFMEAQLFGIPIIATNVGGVSEIVSHNKNGYLIEKDFEPGTIRECLKDYMRKSETEKLLMKQEAYNSWKEKFNAEKNYNMFINKLKNM